MCVFSESENPQFPGKIFKQKAELVEHCKGNYVHASRILGISRMTLRKKLGVTRPWGKRAMMTEESSPRENERDMNPMQKNSSRQSDHDHDHEAVDSRRSYAGVVPFDLV